MMKTIRTLLIGIGLMSISVPCFAEPYKTVKFGNAEVVSSYSPLKEGAATLTLTALVHENNDALRGVKNSDQQRLSKLGQLIYQCKLLLYKPDKSTAVVDAKDPILVSRNFSLFTDVNLQLGLMEGAEIRIQSLSAVNDKSLFSPTLGGNNFKNEIQGYVGEGKPLNLKQLDLNLLLESDLIDSAESLDITVRFPVFQLQKPVRQWHYGFNVSDFKRAIEYADNNCTAEKFMQLINLEQ